MNQSTSYMLSFKITFRRTGKLFLKKLVSVYSQAQVLIQIMEITLNKLCKK